MQIKKILTFIVLSFAVFYLLSRPADAAHTVSGVYNKVIAGADQLAVFFTSVTKEAI